MTTDNHTKTTPIDQWQQDGLYWEDDQWQQSGLYWEDDQWEDDQWEEDQWQQNGLYWEVRLWDVADGHPLTPDEAQKLADWVAYTIDT